MQNRQYSCEIAGGRKRAGPVASGRAAGPRILFRAAFAIRFTASVSGHGVSDSCVAGTSEGAVWRDAQLSKDCGTNWRAQSFPSCGQREWKEPTAVVCALPPHHRGRRKARWLYGGLGVEEEAARARSGNLGEEWRAESLQMGFLAPLPRSAVRMPRAPTDAVTGEPEAMERETDRMESFHARHPHAFSARLPGGRRIRIHFPSRVLFPAMRARAAQ